MGLIESNVTSAPGAVIGVPGYWHESEAILGRRSTAVPDSYLRALLKVGAVPLIIPVIRSDRILEQLFQMVDGLLLIGGPDLDPIQYHQRPVPALRKVTPARDDVEMKITRRAVDTGLPILAICRGIQVLNVALGGTLWQDIATQLPEAAKHDYYPDYPEDYPAHHVRLVSGSRLAGIVGVEEFSVNSLHHQAIDRLGHGLRVVADAPDGVIEAVEAEDGRWIIGVQWHPEWLVEKDPHMVALFQTFHDACVARCRT